MQKKITGLVMLFLLTLGVFTVVAMASQHHDNDVDAYGNDRRTYEHTSVELILPIGELTDDRCSNITLNAPIITPTFIDQATGDEWVAIDSRLCEHGLWGLDILYETIDPTQEPMWVCHGCVTMVNYVRHDDCCNDFACSTYGELYAEIEPFTSSRCPRTGCGGWVVLTFTAGPWGRIDQRLCTHLPWGVDILNSRVTTSDFSCRDCGGVTSRTTREETQWVCHGFR